MIEFLKQNIVEIVTILARAGAWGYERKKDMQKLKNMKLKIIKA